MVNDTSVLIRYSNENRYKFQWYAEFLRYMGYFVCEYLKEDSDSDKLDQYVYDLDIDLDIECESDMDDYIEFWFSGSHREYNSLKTIFKKMNLFTASVTLQYFSSKSKIVYESGILFKRAADELDQFCIENSKVSYEYEYARLYCKQKANLACFVCDGELYFPIRNLISQCSKLNNEFAENANVYMLMGLIYENSSLDRINAANAFVEAKDRIGEKPYVTSVLYRLGKVCEGEEGLRWLLNDSYENAYDIMPKYRNIYKVARQYMEMGLNYYAIDYYKECVNKIENRGDYMDPLEQEYLFKVNAHLAYLSIKNEEFFDAIEYASTALNLKRKIEKEIDNPDGFNRFYYEIYHDGGRDVKEIINFELKRMGEDNLKRYLVIAYQKIGLSDIAEKYWDIVEA